MKQRETLLTWTIFLCAAAWFLWCFSPAVTSRSFYYDEADYSLAASKGIRANAWDSGSLSLLEFARFGLHRVKGNRTDLSAMMRERGDVDFLRHYHPPLMIYWLTLAQHWPHATEYQIRWSNGILVVLIAFLVMLLSPRSFAGSGAKLAGLLGAAFVLLSSNTLLTAIGISMHIMYGLAVTATLLSFGAYLRTKKQRWWLAAASLAAVATCTLAYGVFLVAAMAVCLLIYWRDFEDKTIGSALRRLAPGIAAYVLTMVAIWPASLLKFSVVKSYAFIAYLSAFQKGSFGEGNAVGAWMRRVAEAPLDYAVLTVGIAGWIYLGPKWVNRRAVMPFIVYAFLLVITSLKNTNDAPRYASSILIPLEVLSAVVIAELLMCWTAVARAAAVAVAMLLLGFSLHRTAAVPRVLQPPSIDLVRAYFTDRPPAGRLYAPQPLIPSLRYYFPNVTWLTYRPEDNARALVDQLTGGGVAAVVCQYEGCQAALADHVLADILSRDAAGQPEVAVVQAGAPRGAGQ